MKRDPQRPARVPKPLPAARSRAALGLAARAAEGRFALQLCEDCGAAQYPPRDACERCLSVTLKWRDVEPSGTLVAATTTRVTGEPHFRERGPTRSGIVALDAGPRAVAHLIDAAEPGDRVRLALKLDASGRAAVVAGAEPEGSFGADPRGRQVLIVDGRASSARALAAAFQAAGAARVWVGVAERWRTPAPFAGEAGVELVDLDVTDAKSVERLAQLMGDKVDILVNNLDHFRPDARRAVFEIHALGLMRLAAAFGPVMRARTNDAVRGSAAFVNVISAWALTASTEHPAYAAAQAAARSLSLALRAEGRASGLRVVDVLVGPMDDEWRQAIRPPKVAPSALALALIGALRAGVEEVVVGDVAKEIYAKWAEDPRLARQEGL